MSIFFDKRYIIDWFQCHMAAKFGILVDEDHMPSFVRYT